MTEILSSPDVSMVAGLSGMKVLVIGASQGVGPEVVSALDKADARIVVDAGLAGNVLVADTAEPLELISEAEQLLGGLDVLVLCPPPVKNKPALDWTADELRTVVDSELTVACLQMQKAARIMSKAGYGRIISMLSMSGKAGVHEGVAPYAAAKGGMLAFMRVLAAEMAEQGVTVNGIATALFEPQTRTMTEEKRQRLLKQIPARRFGKSVEAAHAVLFLASPLAGFVTGECLNLSGGRFMD